MLIAYGLRTYWSGVGPDDGKDLLCIELQKSFFKDSVVYASDISPFALKKAKENSLNNGLNVNFVESDFLEYFVKNNLKFDLIVSNPPYIPVKTKLSLFIQEKMG